VIGILTGLLARKTPQQVLVDVRGVGYRVHVSLATFYALPDEGVSITLEIHTVVREDAIHLYGFAEAGEKKLFEQLITVSKIGPKLAQNILSGMAAIDLRRAIASGDAEHLATIPGIGLKTAERMVVELRDKVAVEESAAGEREIAEHPERPEEKEKRFAADAAAALINLGYRKKEAEKVVAKAAREGADDLETLIRTSLTLLNK
jgi:Holliday junction DNA helicase RuvA